MVEIVLRSDVSKYKPKFMFGMTMRGALTVALCLAATAIEAYLLYMRLELPFDIAGGVIVATTAVIAALGMGSMDGVPLTEVIGPALRHQMRPGCTEHIPPELVIREHVPYEGEAVAPDADEDEEGAESDPKAAAKQARIERKERKGARRETEFCDKQGACIKPKTAAKARGIAPAKKERKKE